MAIEVQFLKPDCLLGLDLEIHLGLAKAEDYFPMNIPGVIVKWVGRPAILAPGDRRGKIKLLRGIAARQATVNALRPVMYVGLVMMQSNAQCSLEVAGSVKCINVTDIGIEYEKLKKLYAKHNIIIVETGEDERYL
jgi:hypothetical protein